MPSTRLEAAAGWIDGRHADLIAAVQLLHEMSAFSVELGLKVDV